MTHQALFDVVYSGFRDQGFQQSRGDNGILAFRGEGGRKCAAGFIIPDSLYEARFDVVNDGMSQGFILAHKLAGEADPLLVELISAHDNAMGSAPWLKTRLETVGLSYCLTIPEIARATPLRDTDSFPSSIPASQKWFIPANVDWFPKSQQEQASL